MKKIHLFIRNSGHLMETTELNYIYQMEKCYMKQYIDKHKYWVLALIISVAVCLVTNNISAKMVSLLVAHFLVYIEGICIHTALEEHDNEFCKILCKVLTILGTSYLLICIIVPLIIIPTLVVITVESTNFFVIFWCVWILFFVLSLLSCIALKIISKSNRYRLILFLRYLFNITKLIVLVISFILMLIEILSGVGIFVIETEMTNDMNPYLVSFLFTSVIISEFFLFFAITGTAKFFKNQTMLFFKRPATIVYLRSFTIDQNDMDVSILKQLTSFKEKNHCHLLKVGNPNELFSPVPYTAYYLPTTNWQKSVDKLIKFAQVIFVVMGSSDGLCWEILQYKEYWNKYIFHIPNKDILYYWIELSNNSNPMLNNALHKLEPQISGNGILFYIDEEWLYFSSDVYRIVDAHENDHHNGVSCCKLSNTARSKIKITAYRTTELFGEGKKRLASVIPGKSLYLSTDEINQIKYYKQKNSLQFVPMKQPLMIGDHPTCVKLETKTLFDLFFIEYRYLRLVLEPVVIAGITLVSSLFDFHFPIGAILGFLFFVFSILCLFNIFLVILLGISSAKYKSAKNSATTNKKREL